MVEWIQQTEVAILLFIQENVRCGFLNAVMKLFTYLGEFGALWIVIGLLLVMSRKSRTAGIRFFVVLGISWCICELVLKGLFARPRPFMSIDELDVLVAFPMSYSFPSGHTASSFAAAYVLTREFGKKGAIAYLPAVLIGFSRIYVGVHYLTDVLGGILFGTLFAAILYAFAAIFINIRDSRIAVRRRDGKNKKRAE